MGQGDVIATQISNKRLTAGVLCYFRANAVEAMPLGSPLALEWDRGKSR